MISLATSKITKEVRDNVNAALDDNRIAGGRFIKEFEEKVAKYIGSKHAVAVCNGSMADMVALAALKAKNPEKTEVIVPALTFIAQTNAVLINGLTPVFVDVKDDYQIDVDQVAEKITDKTLAVMTVHLLGKACDVGFLAELCRDNDIYLVEDCCEAYGGEVDGKKFGTFGQFGTFSFFPSHTITTGEGGMVVTDDDELADLARACRNHGRMPGVDVLDMFHFPVFGFNGKMNNLSAAVGCAIADSSDNVITKRKKNVEKYNELLAKNWYAVSPHCYPLAFGSEEARDNALVKLHEAHIEARKLFSSLPTQEQVYIDLGLNTGSFPIAEKIGKTHLFLPIHQDLTERDIQKIVSTLLQ